MPVAPIVGMLRKRLIMDLSTAIGLGVAGGYAYWYGVHLPDERIRDQFYLKYEQERANQSSE